MCIQERSEMKEIVKTSKVYLLNACYKDSDDEVMGCFASMDALLVFFARTIQADHKNEDPEEIVELVASLTADLLGEGSNDECVDGGTRYWYSEFDVMDFKTTEDKDE